jgi:hypothetical protein
MDPVMKRLLVLLLTAGSLLVTTVHASRMGTEGALRQRHFSAEASAGQSIQVGVRLPSRARIARTRVFVDSQDQGDRTGDWAECDIEKKTCSIGDSRIIRFHRSEESSDEGRWQKLAVDVENGSAETRFVRILVLFQPVSGRDRSGCNRAQPRCGFSSPAVQ